MDINRVTLKGNLVADPELRYTDQGIEYVFFTIVTNSFNSKTQEKKAIFHDCVAFQWNAKQLCAKAKKGTPVFFDGKITYDVSGEKETYKKTAKLIAYNIEVCRHWDKKDDSAPQAAPAAGSQYASAPVQQPVQAQPAPAAPVDEKDDLPF